MKICVWLLRVLCPEQERKRMELRKEMSKASAHADDLTRTITMHGDQIQELLRKAFVERR